MTAPTDVLAPVGWVCTRNDPGEIVFEHEEWSTAARTTRESDDRWRVEMVERAGEAESTRTVGYACTREGALDALSTAMSAMNRVADRTGVVRAMLASTLALHGDAGVRRTSPEWRTADRPFDRLVTAETPREPWYPENVDSTAAGNAATGAGNASDVDAASESPDGGSDGRDAGDADAGSDQLPDGDGASADDRDA